MKIQFARITQLATPCVSEVRDFIFLFRSSFIAQNSEIKSCWFKFVICDVMYMQTRKLKNLGFTIKKILSFTSNLHNFENARSNTEQFLAFVAQTHSTKCRIQIQYPNWCYFIYSGNLSDSWCSWRREKGEHHKREKIFEEADEYIRDDAVCEYAELCSPTVIEITARYLRRLE